ncbi:IS110 family transposase [Paenibacillus sabinae]|uniref:IS110 family transposase n=1 Tax=Paenibacillus sabinae TaxID=365617 RepID=UPI00046D521C
MFLARSAIGELHWDCHLSSAATEGFQQFSRWIQDLLKSYNLNKIIVGMEPTGHYWLSLARWLSDKGIEAVLVNPHLVKKNKENRDNPPSKSDRKDALVIADMIK